MSDLTIDQIKQQLQLLYPQLFDDPSATKKLDPLLTQSNIILNQYDGQVTSKQYNQLIELMAAHLLYQSEEHNVNSVQIADVHFSLDDSSKSSSGNGGGGSSDPYLTMLEHLLKSLGFEDWSIQFG